MFRHSMNFFYSNYCLLTWSLAWPTTLKPRETLYKKALKASDSQHHPTVTARFEENKSSWALITTRICSKQKKKKHLGSLWTRRGISLSHCFSTGSMLRDLPSSASDWLLNSPCQWWQQVFPSQGQSRRGPPQNAGWLMLHSVQLRNMVQTLSRIDSERDVIFNSQIKDNSVFYGVGGNLSIKKVSTWTHTM